MGILKEYKEFHTKLNLCTECHGKEYKRISSTYNRNGHWYYDCYKKTWNPCSCGDCGGLIDWSE